MRILLFNIIGIIMISPFLMMSDSIVLDVTQYDPEFNWYNTNGTLPLIDDGIIFSGSDKTNMYQDAISIRSIKGDRLELYTNLSFILTDYSTNPKDEFAIFATSDIERYDKNEFGFVLPENDRILYAYIQSPYVHGFFIWKQVAYIEDKHYTLKAIYEDGKVRFYVDDILVWQSEYIRLDEDMHLAIVSHKISDETIDIKDNRMIIYEAYLRAY